MRRIDSHHHFWTPSRGDYDWLTQDELPTLYRDFNQEDLAPILSEAGVDETILIQAADTVAETRFMLDIAGTTPFVKGVVGWVDMSNSDGPDQLADLSTNPYFRGIRPMIADIADPDWMLGADLAPCYQTLIEMNLTFDALVEPHHLKNLLKLLERHPDLKVVINHFAFPNVASQSKDGWGEDIAEIARSSSALCKFSGILVQGKENWSEEDFHPYMDHVVDCFGPDRLMWGSDWPVVNLAGDYAAWNGLSKRYLSKLSEIDQIKVYGATAASFYGV